MQVAEFNSFLIPLTQQFVLIVHLFAFAFAFVLVTVADLAMLRGHYHDGRRNLERDASFTALLLLALWVSGLILIGMGTGFDVDAITSNGKVFAKLTVVTILTVNGVFLHFYAFPLFERKGRSISPIRLSICTLLGAISSVSWMCASVIGASRLVAASLSYGNFIEFYLICLVAGGMVSVVFIRPLIKRHMTGAEIDPMHPDVGIAGMAKPDRHQAC
ncbi:MAG: hypothetical protein ABID63_00105 [Pseudomonadota bacterium]